MDLKTVMDVWIIDKNPHLFPIPPPTRMSSSSPTQSHPRKVIGKENMRRLIRDVKDVLKQPLHDNGIHYKHDDTNMLQGYAMIIGPPATPYQDGFFFFAFDFPTDYPHLPPTVTYCTNAYNIRFNPNLYRKGKVCLSILNTWQGEQWTSCESLRSVLLHLCGLLNEFPLLNEPGVTREDPEVLIYNSIIEYATYHIAIADMLLKSPSVYRPFFDLFYEEMETHFRTHRDNIVGRVTDLQHRYHGEGGRQSVTLSTEIFDMAVLLDYPALVRKLQSI